MHSRAYSAERAMAETMLGYDDIPCIDRYSQHSSGTHRMKEEISRVREGKMSNSFDISIENISLKVRSLNSLNITELVMVRTLPKHSLILFSRSNINLSVLHFSL